MGPPCAQLASASRSRTERLFPRAPPPHISQLHGDFRHRRPPPCTMHAGPPRSPVYVWPEGEVHVGGEGTEDAAHPMATPHMMDMMHDAHDA